MDVSEVLWRAEHMRKGGKGEMLLFESGDFAETILPPAFKAAEKKA